VPRIRAGSIAEHKVLMRTQLLDAAYKLFSTQGYAGTSLTDVAVLAGVGRTTVYEYFTNKQDLFLVLVEERVPPILAETMAKLPDAPPDERMAHVFRHAFVALEQHLDLAYVLFVVGRELPATSRDRVWRVLDPVSTELTRICQEGVDRGIFRAEDVGLLDRAVADLLVGGVDQVLANPDIRKKGLSVMDARIRFLTRGVAG
jgi:AcrR family transcriptional regulator